MRFAATAATLLCAGVTMSSAAGDDAPPAEVSKSAYCIPLVQWQLDFSKWAQQTLENLWRDVYQQVQPSDPARIAFQAQLGRNQQGIQQLSLALTTMQWTFANGWGRYDPISLGLEFVRGKNDAAVLDGMMRQCASMCAVREPNNNSSSAQQSNCANTCKAPYAALIERFKSCGTSFN
jgi:hypothetical protein